jgi:hypothetical protein
MADCVLPTFIDAIFYAKQSITQGNYLLEQHGNCFSDLIRILFFIVHSGPDYIFDFAALLTPVKAFWFWRTFVFIDTTVSRY